MLNDANNLDPTPAATPATPPVTTPGVTLIRVAKATPATPARASVDWSLWATLAEAAEALGVTVVHANRLAREKLRPVRMSAKLHPPGGGKPQWFIARAYLESEAAKPCVLQASLSSAAIEASERQRTDAANRALLVKMFNEMSLTSKLSTKAIVARVLAHARGNFPELRVCRSALYQWREQLRESRGDASCLIDGRIGNKGLPQVSHEARDAFLDLYLHHNAPSIADCWRQVQRLASENGWTWCSRSNVAARLDDWCIEQERLKVRSPREYRNSLQPRIERDPESYAAGRMWVSDHKQLDLVCRMPDGRLVRPWLTSWQDWRTRKICGHFLSEEPNSSTILYALRLALLDESNKGGPDAVTIDNGRDYKSRVFTGETRIQRMRRLKLGLEVPKTRGLFGMLRIEPHFTMPYSPTGKPRLERFHRTLEAFAKRFETYTGRSTDTKPEALNEVLADGRCVPKFDEVDHRLAEFIDAECNGSADHAIADLVDTDTGEVLSPGEAFTRWIDSPRFFNREALDLLLHKTSGPVTVGRNGIALTIAGRTFHYGKTNPQLAPFKALKRKDRTPLECYFDPSNVETIRVHKASGEFVCVAKMSNRIGSGRVAEADIREASRELHAYNKARQTVDRSAIFSHLPPADAAAAIAERRRREAERLREPPTSMRIVPTPLDGEPERVRAAAGLRLAAGAEGMAGDASSAEGGDGDDYASFFSSMIEENRQHARRNRE